ncbi:hypothetical protein TSAR_004989, partial [Trichomalopsis sarcophagae]
YTYQEIVALLSKRHDIFISVRHLKRILQCLGLRRKGIEESSLEDICAAIIEELNGSGCCVVLDLLRVLDIQGINDRVRHRLKRRVYHVPGPNFLWHLGGYDKLKPYGFVIHGGIDGFSRKILWLEVASTNNKPEVIAYYYLKTLQRRNLISTLMRLNTKISYPDLEVFLKRIRVYWSQMRRQGVHFWINLFKDLIDADLFHDSDPVHVELRDLVPGESNCLYYNPEIYGRRDYKKSVDQHEIITCLHECPIIPHLFKSFTEELMKLSKEVSTSIEAALYLFVKLTTLTAEY